MVDITDPDWLPDIPSGLEPLRPNAGGGGDAASLVGRKQELARLHEAVAAGGAHVTGERRMGKTWLVKTLQEELEDTVTAIYVSAETDTLDLFGERLLQALREHHIVGKKVRDWEVQVGGELKLNIGVVGLTLTGKRTRAALDAGEPAKGLDVLDLLGKERIVLIIDEITYLCKKLGPETASAFLHDVRARRQSGGSPLVISASIGLHHALNDLRAVNDLWPVVVGPLTTDDAVELAARLLLGIGVTPTPQVVADIVRQTSGIPFYIQGVVDQMQYRDDQDVAAVVAYCIANNVWQTTEFVTRLLEYYGDAGAKQAEAVLDIVATCDKPVDMVDMEFRLAIDHQDLGVTRDDLLKLLTKLEMDHYLVREGNADRMSSPLLARLWRHHRRLG